MTSQDTSETLRRRPLSIAEAEATANQAHIYLNGLLLLMVTILAFVAGLFAGLTANVAGL
jgi:hypothetical protein